MEKEYGMILHQEDNLYHCKPSAIGFLLLMLPSDIPGKGFSDTYYICLHMSEKFSCRKYSPEEEKKNQTPKQLI